MSTYFASKYPSEAVPLTFDFSLDLAAGETLSGAAQVTITTFSGIDPQPALLLNGVPQLSANNTQVLVPVQGGIDGCVYQFVVRQPTSNPYKILVWRALLPVNV